MALHEALNKDLNLLAPTYMDMLTLGRKYTESLVDDASTVIEALHVLGKEVWLVTNNFHPAIDIIGSYLHIPMHKIYGVDMVFDKKGKYQGYDTSHPLTRNNGKAEIIKQNIIASKRVAFVGDAFLDLEAKPVVDLFIGYGGVTSREVVRKNAHVFVNSTTLLPILPLLLEEDEKELLRDHFDSSLLKRAESLSS